MHVGDGNDGRATPRVGTVAPRRLTHLQRLEAESIHILREAVAESENPVMLYSVGKDSSVMVHLARNAKHHTAPPKTKPPTPPPITPTTPPMAALTKAVRTARCTIAPDTAAVPVPTPSSPIPTTRTTIPPSASQRLR
jgi:hypothetical protein